MRRPPWYRTHVLSPKFSSETPRWLPTPRTGMFVEIRINPLKSDQFARHPVDRNPRFVTTSLVTRAASAFPSFLRCSRSDLITLGFGSCVRWGHVSGGGVRACVHGFLKRTCLWIQCVQRFMDRSCVQLVAFLHLHVFRKMARLCP